MSYQAHFTAKGLLHPPMEKQAAGVRLFLHVSASATISKLTLKIIGTHVP
jgi:hypothetical protein